MIITSPEAPARTGIGARKDYHALNAQLNLFAPDGSIQFHKDREAAEAYLLQHVSPNTRPFRSGQAPGGGVTTFRVGVRR